MKFYHIYADGKRVKEISNEEYRKLGLSRTDFLLCTLHSSEISFRKGNSWIWLPLRQLKEILNNDS